jgi:hypothetical protein
MKTGKKLRDEGTAAVHENSSDEWKFEADLCMNRLIAKGLPFTSEDLRDAMTLPPHHPNAVGGYWIHAVKRFDLEIVGYKKAERVKSRAHVLPMWIKKG